MDFGDNFTLGWLPGLGIIRKMSLLLNPLMAHAQCVKFEMVRPWGIQLLNQLKTQEISIFARCSWRILVFIPFTLCVFTQSATSSANTLSAVSTGCTSLTNCISSIQDKLLTYWTVCLRTGKLEVCRINYTINSHRYPDILAFIISLSHSINRPKAPGNAQCAMSWSIPLRTGLCIPVS